MTAPDVKEFESVSNKPKIDKNALALKAINDNWKGNSVSAATAAANAPPKMTCGYNRTPDPASPGRPCFEHAHPFLDHRARVGQDFVRIVFDPSGLRIRGKHLELTLAARFEPSVIHDGTSTRGSLVDYQKMVARQWQSLLFLGERPAVGDESSTYHVQLQSGEW